MLGFKEGWIILLKSKLNLNSVCTGIWIKCSPTIIWQYICLVWIQINWNIRIQQEHYFDVSQNDKRWKTWNFHTKCITLSYCSLLVFLQFLFLALLSTSPMLTGDWVLSTSKIDTCVVRQSNKSFLIPHSHFSSKKPDGILKSHGEPDQ